MTHTILSPSSIRKKSMRKKRKKKRRNMRMISINKMKERLIMMKRMNETRRYEISFV